ncbi:monothiol glutaredoxin [Alteromonadaceae bacterium Bs31]|nr:monothiol glutaredoxin [Alteromonadaceae bacterium Bs31]
MTTTEDKIRAQINNNPILLYMKGTPEAPECGYSAATVKAINKTGHEFTYVNVLAAPFIREKLPSISNWPTYPQLFVKGELVGGCDIVLEMVNDGSLDLLLDEASESAKIASGS